MIPMLNYCIYTQVDCLILCCLFYQLNNLLMFYFYQEFYPYLPNQIFFFCSVNQDTFYIFNWKFIELSAKAYIEFIIHHDL
jgi:hypothetical protein